MIYTLVLCYGTFFGVCLNVEKIPNLTQQQCEKLLIEKKKEMSFLSFAQCKEQEEKK